MVGVNSYIEKCVCQCLGQMEELLYVDSTEGVGVEDFEEGLGCCKKDYGFLGPSSIVV